MARTKIPKTVCLRNLWRPKNNKRNNPIICNCFYVELSIKLFDTCVFILT